MFTTTTKEEEKEEIRTPLLRYYICFYGHLSLHLHPTTNKNRTLGRFRFALHFFIFALFNWVFSQPSKSQDQSVDEATKGSHRLTLPATVRVNLLLHAFYRAKGGQPD